MIGDDDRSSSEEEKFTNSRSNFRMSESVDEWKVCRVLVWRGGNPVAPLDGLEPKSFLKTLKQIKENQLNSTFLSQPLPLAAENRKSLSENTISRDPSI